jgi:hypothetical protein
MNKLPNNHVNEVQFIANEWILFSNDETKQSFKEVRILIHTVLFQLIQFSDEHRKKRMVLFYDQVPQSQLRLLSLKAVR